jgi:serine/threonine-protein kinase
MAYYQKAVAIDPNYARGHTQIGNMHKRMGQPEEAINCYKHALLVDSNYGWAHFDLATTLDGRGRLEEAMEHFVKFHEIDPSNWYVTNVVRADMARQGRGEEALREWERDLAAGPASHDAYFGYAEMCLFLGHEDQYRRARQDLLRRFGISTDPNVTEKVARACLLLPGTPQEMHMAAELAQRAVAAKDQTPQWIFPYYRFAEGLAEFRQDHFDSAISIMKSQAGTVMGPAPRLIIAMAEYRKGETASARKTFADAITRFDWSLQHADRRDHFIMHILRREAEAMILQ